MGKLSCNQCLRPFEDGDTVVINNDGIFHHQAYACGLEDRGDIFSFREGELLFTGHRAEESFLSA